jgi:hypothetical protein
MQTETSEKRPLIEIPKELIMKHHDRAICMDTMYVNECGMLTAIVIGLSSIEVWFQFKPDISQKELYRALDEILRYYNNPGFVITEIQHCDGEYHGMRNKVKDDLLDVKLNFTNAEDHVLVVPEAERNNQTIKERIQATFQCLPYKAIPRIMIRY